MEFPSKIAYYTGDKYCKIDNIGMSSATVYIYDDMVLKVENRNIESENEHKMMCWLAGKLPVPNIIEYINTNKLSYLFMSKCEGESACSDNQMAKPKQLTRQLADALDQIWSVDIKGCPGKASLKQKLQQAEYNITHGLVDINDCEPETFGKNGFRDPEVMLYWLQLNQPEEEHVVSHGDFCLPNVFIKHETLSGLIDLGRSGVSDKWCDIAMCYRSLKNNYNGVYTGVIKYDYDDTCFFNALGIKSDWDKIRYYLLLDELF